MKKKNLKNLNLKKQAIANFTENEIKGGSAYTVYTVYFCPSRSCTQGVFCEVVYSIADVCEDLPTR